MALALSDDHLPRSAAGAHHAAPGPYDTALAALHQAMSAIANDDAEARRQAVRSATESITDLYLSLDAKRSGAAATDLGDLYGRIVGRLLRVNLYNDPRIAERVIELLQPLREAPARLRAMTADGPGAIGAPIQAARRRTLRRAVGMAPSTIAS